VFLENGLLRHSSGRKRGGRNGDIRRPAHIEWTVEWTLLDHDCRKILDHNIPEYLTIKNAFFSPKVPDKTWKVRKSVKATMDFYLVLEAPANQKRCVKLNCNKNWTESLRGRTVLEFPQVLVTTQGTPEQWEVVQDERKIVELDNDEKREWDKGGNSADTVSSRSGDQIPEANDSEKLSVATKQTDKTKIEMGQTPVSNGHVEAWVPEKRKLPDDDISNTLAAIKRARNAVLARRLDIH
jgi:hypothetical protein